MPDPPELHNWKPLVEDLEGRRGKALGMGGPDLIARQRSLDKMPVRERLDPLLDPGSFGEYGPLAGRHLVKAATNEDVSEEEMGGSAVHTKVSGVADLEVESDEDCLATVRRYLSFFPSNNREAPPRRPVSDPVDRRCEELYGIVP